MLLRKQPQHRLQTATGRGHAAQLPQVLGYRLAAELGIEKHGGTYEAAEFDILAGERNEVSAPGSCQDTEDVHYIAYADRAPSKKLLTGSPPRADFFGTDESVERWIEANLLAFAVKGQRRGSRRPRHQLQRHRPEQDGRDARLGPLGQTRVPNQEKGEPNVPAVDTCVALERESVARESPKP